MGDPLVDHLRTCCVQVMGVKPGCGFFVTPTRLVTCAHVVGRDIKEEAQVGLRRWADREVITLDPATVVGIYPDDDLAILQTGEENPAFAPLSGEARRGDTLIALGYPREESREKFDQFDASYEGQTQFLDASGRAGVEAKFKAGQVEPGYSGGPLLNLQTGRVMGVVVATRDRRSDLGGWAIEIPVLAKCLAERGIQLPSVDPTWTDAEARQRENAKESALAPDHIRILRELLQAESPAQARVEELSRALGKNQNAMRLALHSLGEHEAEIPDEALPIKLIESMQGFETQLAQLSILHSDDSEVMARFEAAKVALEAESPNLEMADASFEDATELALARARTAEVLEMKAREVREQGQMDAAEACAQRGQLAMASLRYREATRHFKRAIELTPASRTAEGADYLARYATALYRQGDEQGDNAALVQCIDVYRALLASHTRESEALDWATTQNNLGSALMSLGEREAGTARLEEAVVACREALKERTRERVPLDWAMTQNNLGNVLTRLGEREAGTIRFEEAVVAYREALKEYTRERVPLDWAMTQNNLGSALRSLGERWEDTTIGVEALECHIIAAELFMEESPFYASIAAQGVAADLNVLEQTCDSTTFDTYVSKYAETLPRILDLLSWDTQS